jgi:hypothetical protein
MYDMSNTFDSVVEPEFHNKKIKLKCIVTGKTLAPYHIPKKLHVRCPHKMCKKCKYRTTMEVILDATDENILTYIDAKTNKIASLVKDTIKAKCRSLDVEVLEVQSVERIFVARPTGKERTRKGGGSRAAYVIGDPVETNLLYEFEGYTTNDPMTQQTTHVFTTATKVQNDVESFNLSLNKHNQLTRFCVGPGVNAEGMFRRLVDIYDRYAFNITKIYERADLHMVVDMLFRSVISFNFDNERVHKGWLDAMIIGDTRCGKGYVAEKMIEYYGLGETVSGENCSFAGIVGGLQQFNKQWVITWGKIPMNDCGLLVIDETSGMEENMWGKLSRIRSEGIAEITKIQTQITNARTRLLFICNAPNKAVNSYSYGIQAVTDMIKAPEDVARFDYVLVVAHNEVDGKHINMKRTGLPLRFEQELEQDLILWCWSRKADEVYFTPEATNMIYEMALNISKAYDFSIPLIQVENVRFKLAKIAIAMAARFYSNKDNGKYLYVDKVHVECAWIFFDVIYKKDQSGYFQFSKMKMSEMEITTPQKLREIETYFDSWKLQKQELLRCLLVNNYIDPYDITVHLGVNKDLGNECVSNLLKTGCLQKKGRSFIKTPEFTAYLKRILLDRKRLIPKVST